MASSLTVSPKFTEYFHFPFDVTIEGRSLIMVPVDHLLVADGSFRSPRKDPLPFEPRHLEKRLRDSSAPISIRPVEL
ncbi:hypothetical protein PAXRUDRAFT_833052 [Paxillus rubicundulus Ve08.2h10]|uniref:Uncharacterized protein n=1 Tax=Paxillus rubicundulus Ve08.2h10 TaxID=930991 RepID=A0A0D0CZL9_9AGAM|nr:hypothetical protein PAXRUDRAFT_833052 [Paxillus rubicundulus Ve08.2h10]